MYFDEDEKWMINFNEEGEENISLRYLLVEVL